MNRKNQMVSCGHLAPLWSQMTSTDDTTPGVAAAGTTIVLY